MTAINGSTPMPAQTTLPGQQQGGLNVPGGTDPSAYVPGVTVTGQAGSTTLPNAGVGDYASPATDPGMQPDATYPTLLTAHVLMFQAMNTPKELLDQLAAEQPDPAFVEDYLLNQVMPNPEAWDARCGNPAGTARAGLAQLFPEMYGDPTQFQTSNQTTPEGANTVTTPGAEFAPAPSGGIGGWAAGGAAALVLAGTTGLAIRHVKKKQAAAAEQAGGGVNELSRALGGGPGGAAGLAGDGKPATAIDRLRGFRAGGAQAHTSEAADAADHPVMRQLAGLGSDAKIPVGVHTPVGLPHTEIVPLLEVGKKYGIDGEHMLRVGVLNSSLGGLASDDLAKVLGAVARRI